MRIAGRGGASPPVLRVGVARCGVGVGSEWLQLALLSPRGREDAPADGPEIGRRARRTPRDDRDDRCAKERERRGGLARPRPKTLRLQQVCGQVSPAPPRPSPPAAARSSIAIRDAGRRLDRGRNSQSVPSDLFCNTSRFERTLQCF